MPAIGNGRQAIGFREGQVPRWRGFAAPAYGDACVYIRTRIRIRMPYEPGRRPLSHVRQRRRRRGTGPAGLHPKKRTHEREFLETSTTHAACRIWRAGADRPGT